MSRLAERDIASLVVARFGDVRSVEWMTREAALRVPRERLLDVLAYLKDESEFDLFIDLFGIDYPEEDPRFEVVYSLYSIAIGDRCFLRVRVPEDDPKLPSACGIYKGANWFEREVWDMYGLRFEGHPRLERILMYEGFQGHPLRKDYDIDHRQPLVPGAG